MRPGEFGDGQCFASPNQANAGVATAAAVLGLHPAGRAALLISVAAAAVDSQLRTFVTYTLANPSTGQIYGGRASGFGSAQSVANGRYATHFILRASGFESPTVDVSGRGYAVYPAIRGLEQQLIDSLGGVGSPGVANKIRGVAKRNPLGQYYHDASNALFGPLAPFTGGC